MSGLAIRMEKRTGRDGDVVWLEGDGFTIGRSAECDLPLDRDSVSRQHCRIELVRGRWMLSDVGSTNGLFLNPKNLILGIHRDVLIETDKSITERMWIIVLTMRVDVQVEESTAAVLITNIG